MKDKGGLHLKVQEFCDCFATTDPLKEMCVVPSESDKDEGAVKWVALAVLHGINDNAKKISLTKTKGGEIKVSAKYRKSELPSPGSEVGEKIIQTIREISHIEGEKGSIPLAVGIRDSSLELLLKVEQDEDGDTVTIEFPK